MNRESRNSAAEAFAFEVTDRLRSSGYEALWAGGCVRDRLLGKTPKDYDVATSAKPDQVREVFGRRRTVAIGAAFGVITVLGPRDAGQIEVATFRADVGYSDGRRPDAIRYTSAEEDAKRRDFTINGLFFDPNEERVIDFVGGQRDLETKVIRAIGDPDERFDEDRLRLLRAVRFASSLAFQIDEATQEAIRRHAPRIHAVSPERIGVEIRRMLTETDPPRALQLLSDCALLEHTFPALVDAGPGQLSIAQQRLVSIAEPSAPLGLAAVLLEVSTPEEVAASARQMRWKNKEADRAAWLVENRNALRGAEEAKWSRVQPVLAAAGATELVALFEACGGADATVNFCRERLSWNDERLNPPPLLLGSDLIATGRTPGPDFKRLLESARVAQLDGLVDNKNEAIAWIEENCQPDHDAGR